MKTLLALSTSLFAAVQASAGLITYTFDDQDLKGAAARPGLLAGALTVGEGLSNLSKVSRTDASGAALSLGNWPSGLDLGSSQFISFKVTAERGFAFTVDSLSLEMEHDAGKQPDFYTLAYQVGTGAVTGFAAGSTPASWALVSGAMPDLGALDDLTLYVFAYGARSKNKHLLVDNLTLHGSVVPEPSALLPFGALLAGLVGVRRRRG